MPIRWIHWVAALLFWLSVGVASTADVWGVGTPPGDPASGNRSISWYLAFCLLWAPLTVALWRLSAAWACLSVSRQVVAHALILVPVILLHGGLVSLVAGPDRPKDWLLTETVAYGAVAASGLGFVLHQRWRDRDDAAIRFKAHLAEARLVSLDARLQPHFLLNSLDAIESLVRDARPDEARHLICGTRALLRQVVERRTENHTISEEIALVETFFSVQHARFGGRLQTVIEMPPDVAGARVPPLLILPLAENALRHGLAGPGGHGMVRVSVHRRAETLVIKVEDDGPGVEDQWRLEASRGTGLANLCARLHALYGDAASLSAGSAGQGRGFSVTARLPFQEAVASGVRASSARASSSVVTSSP
jgi:Histidine kinase